jgi:hypothetical protein
MLVLVLLDIRSSTELPRHIQPMPQGDRVHPQMFLMEEGAIAPVPHEKIRLITATQP